jgi:hypothetical protein
VFFQTPLKKVNTKLGKLTMATKAQILSREMILPAYKAAMLISFIFSYFLLSPLYICRERSTNPPLFIQNKPNFQKSQINVNKVLERDYENERLHRSPKTNPIQTQSNPKQTQSKPKQTQYKPKQTAVKLSTASTSTSPLSNTAPISSAFLKKAYAGKMRQRKY